MLRSPSCHCRGANPAAAIIAASAIMSCSITPAQSADNEHSLWKVDDFKPRPAAAGSAYPSQTRQSISMDGVWEVTADLGDKGLDERWFDAHDGASYVRISVPGNWNAQGLGGKGVARDEGPMWPEFGIRSATIKGSYVGLAWYRKTVPVPSDWQGRKVRLLFGGVLTSVRLWVNGQFAGGRWTDGNSFYIDVTKQIRPGQPNLFVMAIDNRWKQTATISHYQWYTAAGGPFHHMVLRALPRVNVESAVVWPRLSTGNGSGVAEVHVRLANDSAADEGIALDARIVSLQHPSRRFRASTSVTVPAGQSREVVLPIKIHPVETWSCESPNLYKLSVTSKGRDFTDRIADRFGMRTVASVGNRFELNNKPVFILGQHLNFFWPNTLTPPITKQEYLKHLRLIKDYGFNYLRVPWLVPEECYQAADELGMMIQLEFPYAFNEYAEIKQPLIKRLIAECLASYGNHPSLVLLCMSNEGSWDGKGGLNPAFCAYAKSLDPTRLVMDTDGKPDAVPEALLGDIVSLGTQFDPEGKLGVWAGYMASVARQPDIYYLRPCIDHEFLNVPTLPGAHDISGYRGAVLSPPAETSACWEQIRKQGMEKEYSLYLKASYEHQANFIKEGTERSRKNPPKAGYSMCAWNDIGASIHWAIFDQFMNPKGISAEEMRRYNAESVLLFDFVDPASGQIELVPDYCRAYTQPFTIRPYVSYFGPSPVANATLSWSVQTESGKRLAGGSVRNINPTLYTVTALPPITIGPIAVAKPQEVTLNLEITGSDVQLANSWPLWLFPRVDREDVGRSVVASENVIGALERIVRDVIPYEETDQGKAVTSALWVTDEGDLALEWLRAGRDVLFLAQGGARPNPFDPGWFKGDDHMGSIVRSSRLLGDFPHEGYASWQFRNLNDRARDVPEGPIPATVIVSSAYGESSPHVQHQLFAANTDAGGHLTYCLLKLLSGRCEADYLLRQLLENAGREKSDPVVGVSELMPFLKGGKT